MQQYVQKMISIFRDQAKGISKFKYKIFYLCIFINGVETIEEIPKLEIVYLKLNWQDSQK